MPIPEGASAIIPRLVCRNVLAGIDFCRQALGAKLVVELQTHFWGGRIAWIQDPQGHLWTLASRVEQTTEEQRAGR